MLAMDVKVKPALLVENDARLATRIKNLLDEHCWRVTCVCGADEALKMLTYSRPNVILIDIEMPDWEGLETIARVRFVDDAIPIVAVTRGQVPETRLRSAIVCGATATILGPVTSEQLFDTIDAFREDEASD